MSHASKWKGEPGFGARFGVNDGTIRQYLAGAGWNCDVFIEASDDEVVVVAGDEAHAGGGDGGGGAGCGGGDDRKKRPRTAFTAAQIKALESEFEKNKYLSVSKRMQLSKQLKLTETQVIAVIVMISAHEIIIITR